MVPPLVKCKLHYDVTSTEHEVNQEMAMAKINSYKHKLHVAVGRQREMEVEIEDLFSLKKKLKRENVELREDNERVRPIESYLDYYGLNQLT